ncbi:6-bladed beta-propeller [Bacteroides sp. 519]|uniref:6-bladed beta-propeller n=1 Tax=Bacteroides sp. 519 TaxID=2302937 RepID=UPI0013CFC63F|nr:6-bladed beta-propeller [Bacteroides sp. 519]NDV60659.1 6-bladed beta-propeller [Bacteroides sp. 519]
MKKVTLITIILLIITGCKQSSPHNNLITIDVAASYPQKELVLQNFMNVEYIALETNDEFITQGDVKAIGNKCILVKNWINDGTIFVFDRKSGKGLRKINRRGQGAEEYTFINGIVLDEDNDEMFVNCTPTKQILVYDLSGNFKRRLNHAEGTEYLEVFNYDKDNLICYDMSIYYKEGESRGNQSYHIIISKHDGSITRNISIPFDVVKAPFVQKGDGIAVAPVRSIIPCGNKWLLVETSSDTVYAYVPVENKLKPFVVRTPSNDPEILLTMGTITDRFYFMETVKKVFDFTTGRGFPTTGLMYDKEENAVFNATVLNGDYVKEQKVNMISNPINNGVIATYQNLAANKLIEAYESDGLKGELKEIAAGLNEESNPVIMLVKYKQ